MSSKRTYGWSSSDEQSHAQSRNRGRDVLNPQTHEITSSELTVYCQIEESQVPLSFGKLQARADCQTCFGCNGGFCPVNLPLFQGA